MGKNRGGMWAFAAAACAGLVHAAASLYWALGGSLLLDTVGQFAVDLQRTGGLEVRLLLVVVTAVKVAGAIVPWLDHARPPAHRWVRVVSWLGVVVLLVWGGAGTVGAWIGVAAGRSLRHEPALVGHALLWDPLFVLWGLLLAVALRRSRSWVVRESSSTWRHENGVDARDRHPAEARPGHIGAVIESCPFSWRHLQPRSRRGDRELMSARPRRPCGSPTMRRRGCRLADTGRK